MMRQISDLSCALRRAAGTDRGVWFAHAAQTEPQRGALTYEFHRYDALERRAQQFAAALQARGYARGARIVLVAPAPPDAIVWLAGALHAGVVPLLLPAPIATAELPDFGRTLVSAVRHVEARALVSSRKLMNALAPVRAELEALTPWLTGDVLVLKGSERELAPVALGPDDPAWSEWRGQGVVTTTHGEWLERLAQLASALNLGDEDIAVSWRGPYEHTGLQLLLLGMWRGISVALLAPATFARRPSAGLEVVGRARGTVLFAPERAYERCLDEAGAELDAFDLSSLRCVGGTVAPLSGSMRRRLSRAGVRDAALDTDVHLPELVPTFRGELSHGQRALLFLSQLAPESRAYNVPFALRITSELEPRALRRALEECVERHAALRTVFPVRDGVPARELQPMAADWFSAIDASDMDDATLNARLTAEAARSFDLERGPLFVARLFRRGPRDAVLLLVAHHLCVDGVSILTLLDELAQLYPAMAAGAPSPSLPPLAASYDDFVAWQTQFLSGPAALRSREYWAAQLAGAPATLDLPSDRPRPARQTFVGARLPLALPNQLVDQLSSLAVSAQTTLNVVLLAGFQAFLAACSGLRDIVVGTPVVGRTSAQFRAGVGYFINTLPIRTQIGSSASFVELLQQVRGSVLDALDHQDLPLGLIVEQAKLSRDPGRAPLCQVMFQHQTHRPGGALDAFMAALTRGGSAPLGDLIVEPIAIEQSIAQCDLRLDLRESGGSVAGFWEYNTDLFDRATVERWSGEFVQQLTAAASAPLATLALSAPPAPDPRWNDTVVEYPAGDVPRAFDRWAKQTPYATAVTFSGTSLSYSELRRRADRLARRLRAQGVTRDVLVGVCMERSLELVIALLATMKAGGAYVPLDPTYPVERLRMMVEDAQPALVIVDDGHLPLMAAANVPLLRASELEQPLSESLSEPAASIDPADLGYVIYTSGSTGVPKGVCNTHAGLWNRLCWMQAEYGLTPADRVLHKTPYSFDVSVWELFWPLIAGATLVVARPEGHKDTDYLKDEIARSGVTTMHFVPSMLEAFLDEADAPRTQTLARIFCSGEALPYALMERCLARLPHVELHNLYGPTEAAIDVTAWRCGPHPRGIVPIGRPIANIQIYLLDERQQPVAIGEVGELHIGGVGLARGYHRRPELTAERFIRNPVAGAPSARLYKTGDLARYDADGNIEYLGRNDDQVKLRGFRIELGEIEAVVCRHANVKQCVVAVKTLASGGKRLEAFVVPQRGASDDELAHELPVWLEQQLPEHMRPSSWQLRSELPLTHNGKIDRKALLASGGSRVRTLAAPRTPIETALVAAFGEVLGVRDVSIHDNFFELGGDSIRSLQLRARARQRGVAFDVASLLAHQTIAELAAHAARVDETSERAQPAFALVAPDERASLDTDEYEDAFPLTQLQLGMVYHSTLTANAWTYHDSLGFELTLDRTFDEHALRAALEAVMRCQPMLRAALEVGRFRRPMTLIARDVAAPLTVVDLRGDDSARLHADLEADRRCGYQLQRAPLFRVLVHILADARVRMTISFHHAIMDGWSAAILQRDLLQEYLRLTTRPELPALARPEHGFAAFVELEDAAARDASARDYFQSAAFDGELVPLPRWPSSQLRAGEGAERLVTPLPSAALQACAAALQAPRKLLLLAAHLRVLAAFTGSNEVSTGWVTHGRPEVSEAERIIGLFLNTLPLRVTLEEQSWAELIAQLLKREREMFPYRRHPLREIQRARGGASLFETVFNYVHFHLYDPLLATDALRMRDFEVHENTGFALVATFVEDPRTASLSLHLEYDPARVAPEQARQLAAGYRAAVDALTADVHALARASRVIDDAELARIERWQDGGPALAQGRVTDAFAAAAARMPTAICTEYEGMTLSYAQLEHWAASIAARLVAAGAQPREAVAICAEPGLPRVAAVLGVLEAGCAYLPLDPSFPPDRLSYMHQHARVKRCLTTPGQRGAEFLRDLELLEIESTEEPRSPPMAAGDARDPVYVIYTSGSTGRPKGIAMPHAALANLIAWECAHSSASAGDVTAHFSAFSFDVSFQELFSTWASGGQLVIVPESARKDTRELLKLVAAVRVARLFLPVVVLHELCAIAEELGSELPSLRELCVSGDQLEITPAVRAFFRRHPACRLENHYGPSETHLVTMQPMAADCEDWPLTPPIGRPLPGVRAYVLDDAHRPVPVGVPGELFLGGACLALGYVGSDELTHERFVRDPFVSGARMYTTGDRVRWLPDGTLEYLGRRDGQVKVRGYRIELAEVESAIVRAADGVVQRAIAVVLDGQKQLAAYVLCDASATLDAAALKHALTRTLPQAMVPSVITQLDSLPLTPSGKVDRRALAALGHAPQPDRERAQPETRLERELCALWEEVLGTTVYASDDFFDSGGDSLRAVRLMARVQRLYGLDLPVSALIEAPTVQRFAAQLERTFGGETRAQRSLISLRAGRSDEPPLFCIHPIGGNVLCYMPLARRLGRACYGLQARGLDGTREPHTSVREMAEDYAAEIVARQPDGRIQLAGWSFGGYVAVEMARQLTAAGRELAPVIVADTIASMKWQVELQDDELMEFMAMELLGSQIDDDLARALFAREADKSQKLATLMAAARRRGVTTGDDSGAHLEHVLRTIRANFRAVYTHTLQRYDGEVVLLRCVEPMPPRLRRFHDLFGSVYHAADNGWGQYCSNLRVAPARGDHLSLVLEPHVAQLADVVTQALVGNPTSLSA